MAVRHPVSCLFFHIQQSECARAGVNGDGRGGLLEVDLVEMHVFFDLFADPVCLALGDAYIGYEEDSRIDVAAVSQNGVDVCLPCGFS